MQNCSDNEVIPVSQLLYIVYISLFQRYRLIYVTVQVIQNCSAFVYIFWHRWGGENNPLPDGLIYEGVSDQPIQVCDCFVLLELSGINTYRTRPAHRVGSPSVIHRVLCSLFQDNVWGCDHWWKKWSFQNAVIVGGNETVEPTWKYCVNPYHLVDMLCK